MAFEGEYYHTIDVKGRMFMPAKFREELGETFKVYPSPEGCLFCYTQEKWEDVSEQIGVKSSTYADRRTQRQMNRGISTVSPDKQGRIVISPQQIKHAELSKDVVVYGVSGNRVEIWDLEKFRREMGEIQDEEYDNEIAEKVKQADDMQICL